MYVCTICNLFAGQSFSSVLRHMGNHRQDPGLFIRCGINSCTEQYKNFESFRSHVYRKHRETLHSSHPAPAQGLRNGTLQQEENEVNGDREIDGWESDVNREKTVVNNGDSKRLAALFLLKTHEEHKVT